jgi:hypothetical protein
MKIRFISVVLCRGKGKGKGKVKGKSKAIPLQALMVPAG